MEPLSANDPRMIGEFRLHAQLGAGGMGQVYLGFSPAGRAVAIKVIHAQFARDQEFLRRFSHEVAAASAVGGMYTAPVVDYDLQGAMPWLATAYVPGPTLATVVNKHGALPEPALWRLAAGLTEALRAVHAKGLIHRDLKPANVLLADSGPHVIDFGISRASSSMTQLTSAGMAIGTPGYMSPEQAQVQTVGPPSDLFSLGCVLAFAAAGRAPFNGDNPASILFKIVSSEPDLSAITPAFRQVIEACLKKNPAERPTPGQLIAKISELGPVAAPTLGSFWPESVARIIAVEQAAQTPDGLTPPAPFAAGSNTAGMGGLSGPTAGLAPSVERSPTALSSGAVPGQPLSGIGNGPMISDGYLAAAAQRPSGPSIPPASAPPQGYYSGQQPYVPPGGQTPSGTPAGSQSPFGQGSFGQATFGQGPAGQAAFGQAPSGPGAPYSGQAPGFGAQHPSYPGMQPYAGQQAGGFTPMPAYTPGRRKPMSNEVPKAVHNAVRLMYAGFAVTAVDLVLSIILYVRYSHLENQYTAVGDTAKAASENDMAGSAAIGLFANFLGLAFWVWLALAARRGNGWTRTVGSVLLGIYTIVALFIIFGTKNDPGATFTTIIVWGIGLATLFPLWSQQAREFFLAWRKH